MSDNGPDLSELFRRGPPRGPRVRMVRSGPLIPRRRRIVLIVVAAVIALIVIAFALMGLRVQLLFLESVGHSNVFWTPVLTGFVLFILGLLISGGLMAANIAGWWRAAGTLDPRAPRWAMWFGIALAVLVGVIVGGTLAGQWQTFQLWMHGHAFNARDPAFHKDYSFFLFTLPVIDIVIGVGWAVAIVSLLFTIALGATCLAVEFAPTEVPIPLRPPKGVSPRDGLRTVCVQAGGILAAVFVLAALSAHFGAYHLATSQHDNFVGLDATERGVTRPILGALQVFALLAAVAVAAVTVWRRARAALPTAITLGSMLFGWLVFAGLLQWAPAAIYEAARVTPNASTLQLPPIADYLATTRYAWALEPGSDVQVRNFGAPQVPTTADLAADPGTLKNVRIQDFRQLPETFAQIDRTRSFQTFSTVTVDRYPGPNGQEQEVMLAPREIAEADIPSQAFVNRAFQYTHGYGISVASVNQVTANGNPDLLAGGQPLQLLQSDAPPALDVKDPRIYCGLSTTQPVVVNTSQQEFDYLGTSGEVENRYGNAPGGMQVPSGFDRLAMSVNQFAGLDLFLTASLTSDSKLLIHRQIQDRINTIAPFLTLDGDPYIVADPQNGHLMWIADAYVSSDLFPEAYQQGDGTSYMRNAVKAVVDARTCQTTLYAVNMNEPITATYNAIFPGLLTPISKMPATLQAHLRYPEDLFQAQARAYTAAHIDPSRPLDLFNKGDLYRVAQEILQGSTQDTQPYYVELTLPGETQPRFVLEQAFSPAQSSGGGGASNIMTAMLVADTDYSAQNGFHPGLVEIRLNSGDNVLGPLQFDNNLNTDKAISSEISLLNQSGSQVVLGNVIVLPFNNDSFLYVRPLYVQAAGGSFPQLREVLVGTQTGVAQGVSFADALTALFGQAVTGAPGVVGGSAGPSPTPTPLPSGSPSPGASPTPSRSATPAPTGNVNLTPQVAQVVQDLLSQEAAAQSAFQTGNSDAYARAEAQIQSDLNKLKQLLGPGVSIIPTPAPTPTP